MTRHLRVNILGSNAVFLHLQIFESLLFIHKFDRVTFPSVSITLLLLRIVHSPVIAFMSMTFLIHVSPHRKNFATFMSARLEINIPGFTWFFSPSVCLFPVSNFVGASGLLNKWNFSVFCCKYSCFWLSLGPLAVPPLPSPDHLSIACWLPFLSWIFWWFFCISFATSWASLLALPSVPKGLEMGPSRLRCESLRPRLDTRLVRRCDAACWLGPTLIPAVAWGTALLFRVRNDWLFW